MVHFQMEGFHGVDRTWLPRPQPATSRTSTPGPWHSESETLMPEVLFSHDPASKMSEQHTPRHNRWHPEIPAAATARSGQEVRIECREWTDGQIGNNDTADDVRNVDLDRCHMLSGPIE